MIGVIDMEIRVLRYFLTVAREQNMTRAAEHLHVTQPTLSKQLKQLEEEIGKKLFIRSNYSIKLTDEGVLLRKRAEDILDMVDKTMEEFQSLDDITGGDIYIGTAESNGITPFIQVLKQLLDRYSSLRIHFYSSGIDSIDERLDKGLLDFAIVVQEVDLSKYNYLKIESKDRWGLLMRKDDVLAQKKNIQIEDLMNIPLICSRQSLIQEMPKWFGESLDKLHIVATYDLIFNTSIMVREGMGYALGFEGLIYTGKDSNLCFRPLDPVLVSPMYIIWKKYQVFTPIAQKLLDEIEEYFQK